MTLPRARRVRRRVRAVAWRGALAVGRAAGRLSAGRRVLPDLLVVGAQRGGTTSLYQALRQHPAFLPPLRKGVHYFDMHHHRGLDWYRSHFPTRRRMAAAAADRGHPMITGELSPYYMWHPLAAQRIAAQLPGAVLVAMLRDPVERAYSAHAHELARGFETEAFARAVELEPERLAGERERMRADPRYASHAVRHHAYLARGQYVEQLEALAEAVGRDRLYVVDSDEFFTDPRPAFAELCALLGIPSALDRIRFARHNARPRAELPEALRQRLSAHFAPYDERLARWWGRVPSWRR